MGDARRSRGRRGVRIRRAGGCLDAARCRDDGPGAAPRRALASAVRRTTPWSSMTSAAPSASATKAAWPSAAREPQRVVVCFSVVADALVDRVQDVVRCDLQDRWLRCVRHDERARESNAGANRPRSESSFSRLILRGLRTRASPNHQSGHCTMAAPMYMNNCIT